MGKLNIQLCPETGICSIVKTDGTKVDLMPDEVKGLKAVAKSPQGIRDSLSEVDSGFASQLDAGELDQIAARLT
jgi:hypothetical protein